MLHLNDLVKQDQHTKELSITERLPSYIATPCHVKVTYQVEAKDKFYLIRMNVCGDLTISCQRCLDEFVFPYENQTEIAACRTDERAEQLLEMYECVVAPMDQVDLTDLVVDELHLYAPLFHAQASDCADEITQIFNEKS
ncbi:MAG: metal-binding protein [Legionella sp.]|nr:MAG: metal-binding protein [Legionella sp.]